MNATWNATLSPDSALVQDALVSALWLGLLVISSQEPRRLSGPRAEWTGGVTGDMSRAAGRLPAGGLAERAETYNHTHAAMHTAAHAALAVPSVCGIR